MAIRKYWETSTLKKKLILIFIPLALVPMICLTLLSIWMYSNQISRLVDNNVTNTANLMNDHLNTYLNEITRLSVLPYYNGKILDILGGTGSIGESDFNQVQNLLSQAIRNPREDLQGVFIYRRDGKIFYSTIYNADINYEYDYKSSDWYKQAIAANGRAVFTGKVIDSRIRNRPQSAFSVARAIKLYNGPILGVVIIDVNFTGLEHIFQNVGLGQDSNIIVLDQQNDIIYSKNRNYLGVLPDLRAAEGKIRNVRIGKDELAVHVVNSADTGWKIVSIVSSSEMNREKSILYRTVLMVSAVILLIVVIVSVLLSATITKPLKTLRELMGKVENGDFNVSYQSLKGIMEITYVGRAFNKMNEKINDLIHQVFEIRIKKQEAELNNLKLQIRPHFLYNNLEAIRALAEIGDRKGIAEMTSALGKMLRYSLSKQDAKVRLSEEIGQIDHYLRIEQIRSGHALQVEYDLDERLLPCFTIPILLQPVVENCIIHGFDQISEQKKIRIHVQPDEKGILIRIADNGKGMSADDLDKLRAYVAEESDDLEFAKSGIGLRNLAARIRLEYGRDCGLSVESAIGVGTEVRLRIPRMERQALLR